MAFALINAASAGNNAVINPVAGKKIRIKRIVISAITANNVKFQQDSNPDLSGLLYLPATTTLILSADGGPLDFLWELPAGTAFSINLSAATTVSGFVTYSLE